jgi:hypothetical protein
MLALVGWIVPFNSSAHEVKAMWDVNREMPTGGWFMIH